MKLSLVSDDGVVARLKAAGDVTQPNVSVLDKPFSGLVGENPYARTVLIDLGEADLIDTSGIGWLVGSNKRCKDAGGRLILHSISPMVLRVLKMLRLNLVFEIADNEQEAIALAQGNPS